MTQREQTLRKHLTTKLHESDIDAIHDAMKDNAMDFAIWIGGYENLIQCKKFFHCETTEQLYNIFNLNKESKTKTDIQ